VSYYEGGTGFDFLGIHAGVVKVVTERSISAPGDVGTTCREISRARGLFGSEKEKKKKKYPIEVY